MISRIYKDQSVKDPTKAAAVLHQGHGDGGSRGVVLPFTQRHGSRRGCPPLHQGHSDGGGVVRHFAKDTAAGGVLLQSSQHRF